MAGDFFNGWPEDGEPVPMTNATVLADRIKLAEAMGWTHVEGHRLYMPPGQVWGDGLSVVVEKIPDPFTDANDDYAVLEWAIKNLDPDAFFAALTEVVGSYAYLHEYRIGYFARAALKVIDND